MSHLLTSKGMKKHVKLFDSLTSGNPVLPIDEDSALREDSAQDEPPPTKKKLPKRFPPSTGGLMTMAVKSGHPGRSKEKPKLGEMPPPPVDECIPLQIPHASGPPKVPSDPNVDATGSTKGPLSHCAGNICWTTPETTLATAKLYLHSGQIDSQKFTLAPPIWIWAVDDKGNRVLVHDTPSRTRSTTLFSFIYIPVDPTTKDVCVFGKSNILSAGGPAWSCPSRSTRHKSPIPVIRWETRSCPLCEVGRHRGNTLVHDFALVGSQYKEYELDWPDTWSELTSKRSKKQNIPS